MIRSYILPDEEYLALKEKLQNEDMGLEELLIKWEKEYESLFGKEEMGRFLKSSFILRHFFSFYGFPKSSSIF